MKKAPQNDEWSVEPVRFDAPEFSVIGLSLLLAAFDQHIRELQTKWGAELDAPDFGRLKWPSSAV